MKTISEVIGERLKKKHISERGELLNFFHSKLRDRKGKPFNIKLIAIKLGHVDIKDLYFLRSRCIDVENRGGSFGKCFWGSLKAEIK